jgi:hypothetical protein
MSGNWHREVHNDPKFKSQVREEVGMWSLSWLALSELCTLSRSVC